MSNDVRIYVAIRPQEFSLLYDDAAAARLKELGTVDFAGDDGPKVALPDAVADSYDVLITSWSTQRFEPETLAGSRLRLAVHSAGSVRGLFAKSVLNNGMRLAQGGAAAMALPVAEMSLTLTLALLRNLHTHDRGLQTTRDWTEGGRGMLGNSIQAQRIGVVGLSRTGRHYTSMLRGLGVEQILAYDPYTSAADAEALGVQLVDLDELCRSSGVVAVHAPTTPETKHLLNAEKFALMADDTIVVNTARSWVLEEQALLAEVSSGRLRAGLDVFDTEPLPADSGFYGLPNVLITPHVAGGTVEARHAQGATVIAEVERFLRGAPLEQEVTADNYDRLA
ncbi:MAG TPA: hydroxyacid dehydrogenase [Beutenbergiaceae bacterium]|nr:hydroxyacid dehydrogenase [Beutenbergiaceae bacterium]